MNISIEMKENDQFTSVDISGEIDAYTAPKLRESLFHLSEKEGGTMVINLSGVSYMDSTGLGVFVGVYKNIRSNNGQLYLQGLSARLMRLFEITGLSNIMDISSKNEGEVR
ncbi:anti-sigma B factor antagonist [Cytobacillus eiseniae]|uniref:Anti-sigma factor antagonist n=1 Tax=Cytobacillus eiseniae TaxID=762947 RepID=A0ABS4RK09_9BACI|nr:anti-sigma factor antagonist [Cytobacillus eiseniae]MBP2243237.1 anti-sigma B factor antagonist [Cytobacillus eiseniae]